MMLFVRCAVCGVRCAVCGVLFEVCVSIKHSLPLYIVPTLHAFVPLCSLFHNLQNPGTVHPTLYNPTLPYPTITYNVCHTSYPSYTWSQHQLINPVHFPQITHCMTKFTLYSRLLAYRMYISMIAVDFIIVAIVIGIVVTIVIRIYVCLF